MWLVMWRAVRAAGNASKEHASLILTIAIWGRGAYGVILRPRLLGKKVVTGGLLHREKKVGSSVLPVCP